MGLFGKLFSKKTDPELERILKQILAGGKEPKDPQGLTKSAVKGAEMRHWLFKLLEEFETETGKIGGFEGDDGFFYHPQLIDWFQKRHGLPESMLFLESLSSVAFSTPEKRIQMHQQWPTILAPYQGKPNTKDILIDKADRLAHYVILHLGIATELYRKFIEVAPDKFHEINDQVEES
jgi:hypothetical protein